MNRLQLMIPSRRVLLTAVPQMRTCRTLAILMALPLIPTAWSQQLPLVYFNHATIYLDKAIVEDLAASLF
jgi:hypothetical protein